MGSNLKLDSLETDLDLKTIRSHYQCLLFNDIAVLICYLWVFCPFDFMFLFYSRKSFEGETKGHESLSDLKAELESLERDLSFLTAFTGFHFTSHSKKTLERSKRFCALY